ncbi:TRAP transporter small permease [Bacillus thermotolerans]|uniref:TRAP transporter small permease n=1 Tax=Bacillus thermotolerans TaxID=1221996 RepID=UPI00057C3DB5|nr:TRAP transporter small permease [Bacillus thermotolerans]KKB33268.1 TRAP-type C4-dicarboxylate transport system, small permease component [Bacillus thermotolerans]
MSKVIAHIENALLAATMLGMVVITFANVISRYFFHYSLSFTEEITINLFVLLTFLGAAAGLRTNAHLGFTLLFDKASAVSKKLLIIFSTLLTTVVFVLLTYYGYDMMMFQMERNLTTTALGWPQWVFSLVFPLGCLFCVYRALEAGVKEWQTAAEREEASL